MPRLSRKVFTVAAESSEGRSWKRIGPIGAADEEWRSALLPDDAASGPWEDVKVGQLVTGVVRGVQPYGAWIDYGGTRDGLLRNKDFSQTRVIDLRGLLTVGEEVKAIVCRVDPEKKHVSLSTLTLERTPGAMLQRPWSLWNTAEEATTARLLSHSAVAVQRAASWRNILQLHVDGTCVLVTVQEVSPRGIDVLFDRHTGFIRWSNAGTLQDGNRQSLVGRQLPAVVIAVSEDPTSVEFRYTQRAQRDVKVGELVTGVVLSVQPTGAWVDYGGARTAVLRSDRFSRERVEYLEQYLTVGEEIKVIVLSVDPDRGRVVLSTKWLERTPGAMLRRPRLLFGTAGEAEAEKARVCAELSADVLQLKLKLKEEKQVKLEEVCLQLQKGRTVAGVVKSVKPYGAFVDIGDGNVGLLHVSQVSQQRINNLGDHLADGDELQVLVVSVDKVSGRIVLSTKRLERVPGGMLCSPRQVFDTLEDAAAAEPAALAVQIAKMH